MSKRPTAQHGFVIIASMYGVGGSSPTPVIPGYCVYYRRHLSKDGRFWSKKFSRARIFKKRSHAEGVLQSGAILPVDARIWNLQGGNDIKFQVSAETVEKLSTMTGREPIPAERFIPKSQRPTEEALTCRARELMQQIGIDAPDYDRLQYVKRAFEREQKLALNGGYE